MRGLRRRPSNQLWVKVQGPAEWPPGSHFGFPGRAEVTEVQPAHARRRRGAQVLSTEPAGSFNHTAGLETQHFLSAEPCRLSCHDEESECLPLRHWEARTLLGRSPSAEDTQGRPDQLCDKRRQWPREGGLVTTNCLPALRGPVSGEGTAHRNARRHSLGFAETCQCLGVPSEARSFEKRAEPVPEAMPLPISLRKAQLPGGWSRPEG